jgi:hypothetical protein
VSGRGDGDMAPKVVLRTFISPADETVCSFSGEIDCIPKTRSVGFRSVSDGLRWVWTAAILTFRQDSAPCRSCLNCGIPDNYDMPYATVIDYLSRVTIFQGYGPWWLVLLGFLAVLPKTLNGAADVIRALAEWSKAKR